MGKKNKKSKKKKKPNKCVYSVVSIGFPLKNVLFSFFKRRKEKMKEL